MDIAKILEYLAANTKILKRIVWAVLALLVVIDFFLHRHHSEFFWDEIPGFSAIYGFGSCVLIIAVAKALGHFWLARPENYYEKSGGRCDD